MRLHALLDDRQPVDHVPERTMYGAERVLRARDFVLRESTAGASPPPSLLALMSSICTSRSASPRSIASRWPRREIGGVELLHQRGDTVFKMADGNIVAARQLDLLDLVAERAHQRFQLWRHRAAALRALGEGIGQRVDAMFEMLQSVAAAGGEGDVLDVLRQPLYLGGEMTDHFVGGDVAADVAQRVDGVLELLHCRRVLLGDDQIDLVREAVDRVVEADQVFRRRKTAQGVAHFGEAVLDAGKGVAVDTGLPALGDALGQPRDLPFDGVDRVPRHGFGERVGDLAEFAAQGVDRFLNSRFAQRLDLARNGA